MEWMRTVLGSIVMILVVIALHPAVPGNLGEETLLICLLYVSFNLLPVVGNVLLGCVDGLRLFCGDAIDTARKIVELVCEELRRRISFVNLLGFLDAMLSAPGNHFLHIMLQFPDTVPLDIVSTTHGCTVTEATTFMMPTVVHQVRSGSVPSCVDDQLRLRSFLAVVKGLFEWLDQTFFNIELNPFEKLATHFVVLQVDQIICEEMIFNESRSMAIRTNILHPLVFVLPAAQFFFEPDCAIGPWSLRFPAKTLRDVMGRLQFSGSVHMASSTNRSFNRNVFLIFRTIREVPFIAFCSEDVAML